MCGIAGIWSKKDRVISQREINNMIMQMRHRGPDAQGSWFLPKLALGHARLKILDLSDAANQPFSDGEDALVFNGEIFNYVSLRKELSDRFVFKTKSDTEVLFRALQTWDEETLDKINGQFAFAFYRASSRTLLIARDHVGICPLYTFETEDAFYFASEIRPLLSIAPSPLNRQGVIDYFVYRYNIQNRRTLFKNILRFPAAHFLKLDLNNKQRVEKRYWRLRFKESERSPRRLQEELNRLLDVEIAAQQAADVPVGLYLSGGIDSGALLTGFAKGMSDIKSFTMTFPGDNEDSLRVTEFAKMYGFEKEEIKFSENGFSQLEDAVFSLEEPFGDLIICANYLLAQNASRKVKVVLSGEGGDESFCGYDHQRAFMKMRELSRHKPTNMLARILLSIATPRAIAFLNTYPGRFEYREQSKLKKVFDKIREPAESYLSLVSLFEGADLESLFSDDFKCGEPVESDATPIREVFAGENDVWRAVMRSEIEQLTLTINLLKQDRFGMRFSMEGRVPLVSKQVLEFAASLPYYEIFSKVNKIHLIRYSGLNIIKKKPFSLFFNKLFLGELIKLMDKYVTESNVKECSVLSWSSIQRIKLELPGGGIIIVKQAMAVLIFLVWFTVFKKYITDIN